MVVHLDEGDVRAVLRWDPLIAEIESALTAFSAGRVIQPADSREVALKESGDVILSRARIYAEAGGIFGGTKPAPVSDTTVFKSVGLAIEDLATACLVYDATRARRPGSE